LPDCATFGDWLACAVGVATLFCYCRHALPRAGPPLFLTLSPGLAVTTMRDNPRNAGIGLPLLLARVPGYLFSRWLFSRARPTPGPAMPQWPD